METEATVSGETMEDVLRELGFKPVQSGESAVPQMWNHFERGMVVRQYLDGHWEAATRCRTGWLDSPAHLRRIVEAEVACAAAWRGEEAGTKETDR